MVEGTDGVGRSTHIALLRTWLESRGHAVLDTGMTRSILAGRGIKEAKTKRQRLIRRKITEEVRAKSLEE